MQERIYRGRRLEDALAQVKRDLGPGAMIVSSRGIPAAEGGGDVGIELTVLPADTIIERPIPRRRRADTAADVQADLGAALRRDVKFADPERDDHRLRAFVGPTGVGKTTTIAKLAARAALLDRKRVALLSLDNYRVGGADQLARYADLIGVPIEFAHDAASLDRALDNVADADVVFIDTEGRAPRDQGGIRAMADCLRPDRKQLSVYLCLASHTRDAELQTAIDQLKPLRPRMLVMTKLDETIDFGAIVAAQVWSGLPLAYFTTGQRVPEDIEVASPERLANMTGNQEVRG